MTEIAFHFNIPDRIAYVCRLLRKAVGLGNQLVVTAPQDVLRQMDERLWHMGPADFLGHALMPAGEAATADVLQQIHRHQARIWLVEDASHCERHDVLVNLMPDVPKGFEQFGKLVEIVSLDDNDRNQARERWRYYQQRGYPIHRHDVQPRS